MAAAPASETVYREIGKILQFGTRSEVVDLLNNIDVSGQRKIMAQRNRYIVGNNDIPLFPCLDIFKKIPKVHFEGKPIKGVNFPFTIYETGRTSTPINYKYITGGSFGEIYQSDANVMKQIKFKIRPEDGQNVISNTRPENRRRHNLNPILPIEIENERASREFFIELVIQIILHNDPDVGQYIPDIQNVYVNQHTSFAQRMTRRGELASAPAVIAPMVSRTTRTAAAAAAAAAQQAALAAQQAAVRAAVEATEGNKAYITMEYVKDSFQSYCANLYLTKGSDLEVIDIAPIFRQLGNLLHQVQSKYNFRHGDLHCGNVMINASGDIQLIDFGMSCIEYDGNRYKAIKDYERYSLNNEIATAAVAGPRFIAKIRGCDSYDLLIFLTSLIEYNLDVGGKYRFSTAAKEYMKGLLDFTLYGNNYNLYSLLEQLFTAKGNTYDASSVFHMTYPWQLDSIRFDFPSDTGVTSISLRKICSMIHGLRPDRFYSLFDNVLTRGAIVSAARGGVPPAGPPGLIRRCVGGVCNWISRRFTRKDKNARRARNTRRRRN